MELDRQIKIDLIINEPWHGSEFYNASSLQSLYDISKEIKFKLDNSKYPVYDHITAVNNYVKSQVKIRHSYFEKFMGETDEFDKSELIYRTAYAALVKNEAMCAGFVEALRVLLSQYNIPTYTFLSKLPGANKQLLHYVCVAEHDDEYLVLDPEREANCERKGYDFKDYLNEMTYIVPDMVFAENKILENGVGEKAIDFLNRDTTVASKGVNNVKELVKVAKERRKNYVSRYYR